MIQVVLECARSLSATKKQQVSHVIDLKERTGSHNEPWKEGSA
jgi:hypothetical protein